MSFRDEWRRVLDLELHRWSSLPYDDLIAALRDYEPYQIETYRVEVEVLEITEKYLHLVVAVGDGAARPLTHSFFCPAT